MKRFFLFLVLLLVHCGPTMEIERPLQRPGLSQADPEEAWLKIIVLDVGQGDATLLIEPEGKTVLIDTGPPNRGAQTVLSALKEQSVEAIQNIFISHDHEDHTGGLETLLSDLKLDRSTVIDKTNAKVGQTIALGSVSIRVKGANGQIGPDFFISEEERSDENALSLALLVQYGSFRYFTDGDLPGGGGNPPYQTIDLETVLAPLIGDVDVILVPHHGSHTSSNENFLDTLKPETAILSLGNGNDFFHPHPSVLTRLKNRGIKIYATEKGSLRENSGVEIVNGSICILTDGETYAVKPYSQDKCASPPSLSN